MIEECERLNECGFFKKYKDTVQMACRGFISLYCKGPKMDECQRKAYFQKHGRPPVDEMMPSGGMITKR